MKKNEVRYYKKIAQHLLLSLNISNDQSLIMTFGTGAERTNEEAITTWVQSLNINPELYTKEHFLNLLQEAAKEHIEHAMDLC
ncbi:hypothetical protein [Ghiorsea bivora]|uniref:hypothetical protein n=1 Tax=Ghiorsea bivora TaxID=1485545 RepID=UPI000570FF7B|nr:hypothetical protein [Ghiorsea bivora]